MRSEDVYQLYKLSSDPLITNPKMVFADQKLSKANWMTRVVIKLEECPSKFPLVSKICKLIAKVIFYFLQPKAKGDIESERLGRQEILNFQFKDAYNTYRLVRGVTGVGNLKSNPFEVIINKPNLKLHALYEANEATAAPSISLKVNDTSYILKQTPTFVVSTINNEWKLRIEAPNVPPVEKVVIKDSELVVDPVTGVNHFFEFAEFARAQIATANQQP